MISVTILTKNSQQYLLEVLESVKDFSEVVVYDTGSNDETLKIAKQFPNVTIYQSQFEGFGPTHNKASSCAKNDWILSIDSDEVLSAELVNEIKHITLNPACIYSFPRNNYYNGKWIRWCGWYPDRQLRLYNRQSTQFTEAQVHESIQLKNLTHISLQAPLKHYSYKNLQDFLSKMQLYSTLFATQNKGKNSSPWKAIGHGFFAFFKSYFIKKGFLGGYEGFIISAYNGHTAFYKYLKLYEANFKK